MGFVHEKIDLGYQDLDSETGKSGRQYVTPDGARYPSVTTVLSILKEKEIAEWRQRVGEDQANKISTRASNRGSAVHSIIEGFINNEDTSDYLPHIKQSLNNLKPHLERISTVYGQEVALYSQHLGLAGRVDCVGVFDNVPSIIDFKTSRRVKRKEDISNYFAQMSAYAIMWEERTGMPIVNTVVIMDVDNNSPLVFKEHRDNYTDLLLKTIKEYERRQLFH